MKSLSYSILTGMHTCKSCIRIGIVGKFPPQHWITHTVYIYIALSHIHQVVSMHIVDVVNTAIKLLMLYNTI